MFFTKTTWKIESSAGTGVSLCMGLGVGAEAGTITLRNTRWQDKITLQILGAGGLVGVGANGKAAQGLDAGMAHDNLPSKNSYIYACGSQSPKMYGEDFGGYAVVGKVAGGIYGTAEAAAIMFTDRQLTSFSWSDIKAFGFLSGLTVSFGAGASAGIFQFSVSVSGIDVFRTDQRALDRCRALRGSNPSHFADQQNTCTFGGTAKGKDSGGIRRFRSIADKMAYERSLRAQR